jgi:hypothetical protein
MKLQSPRLGAISHCSLALVDPITASAQFSAEERLQNDHQLSYGTFIQPGGDHGDDMNCNARRA